MAVAKWESARRSREVALWLSVLSPAGSWLKRLSEVEFVTRILRLIVSSLCGGTYKTSHPGDAQVRKVGGLKKVRFSVSLGPGDGQ